MNLDVDRYLYIFSLLQILQGQRQGTHQQQSQGNSPQLHVIGDVTTTSDEVAHHQMYEASGNQEVQEDSNVAAQLSNAQLSNQCCYVPAAPSNGEIYGIQERN